MGFIFALIIGLSTVTQIVYCDQVIESTGGDENNEGFKFRATPPATTPQCDFQKFLEMMQMIKSTFPCINRDKFDNNYDDETLNIVRTKKPLPQPQPRYKIIPPNENKNSNIPKRLEELDPEEREERINRGFARLMQMMTFFGHVDNFLTDKASSLVKLMGRAIEADDDRDPNIVSNTHPYRITRTCPGSNPPNTC